MAAIRWKGHAGWLLVAIAFAWFVNLPDMLSAATRAGIVVLFVAGCSLLYWLHLLSAVTEYTGQLWNLLPYGIVSILVPRPKRVRPRFRMTYRELLWGDGNKERARLLAQLERNASEEPDPQLRRAYEASIEALRVKCEGSSQRNHAL